MSEMIKDFPPNFDWRNKEGEDFVTPIRNQGSCGSCYSFASMGCLEAGVAIASNGRIKPIFSPQYIVSCSNYSQGCDGGKERTVNSLSNSNFKGDKILFKLQRDWISRK